MPAGPVRAYTLNSVALSSLLKADSDVISGRFVRLNVPEKGVKVCDPRINRSEEIRTEAVGCGNFYRFCRTSINANLADDVISGISVKLTRLFHHFVYEIVCTGNIPAPRKLADWQHSGVVPGKLKSLNM